MNVEFGSGAVTDHGNVVRDKRFRFAVRIVRMAQHLRRQHSEFVLSKQVLRSGTRIGANVEEALAGQSRKDFIANMAVASKETRETIYWIRLLKETEYLDERSADSLLQDCGELKKLLTSIVKSSQEN